MRTRPLPLLLALLLASPSWAQGGPEVAPAQGQGTLPIGTSAKGETRNEAPAVYAVTAETAGVLTVVVRGLADGDLGILVTDEDGQSLPDGRSDRDLGGTRGAEQLAVTLPWPGRFLVRIEGTSFEPVPFMVAGGFLSLPSLEAPQDKDGRPRGANTLEPGKAATDSVNPAAGDTWDWYAVQCPSAGALTVVLKAPEGDLVLEAFAAGAFRDGIARSDQDMGGVRGNESLTLNVQAGQTIYFRVAATLTEGAAISYKLSTGLIPD